MNTHISNDQGFVYEIPNTQANGQLSGDEHSKKKPQNEKDVERTKAPQLILLLRAERFTLRIALELTRPARRQQDPKQLAKDEMLQRQKRKMENNSWTINKTLQELLRCLIG